MTETTVIRRATQPGRCTDCGRAVRPGDRVLVLRTEKPDVVHAINHHEPTCIEVSGRELVAFT